VPQRRPDNVVLQTDNHHSYSWHDTLEKHDYALACEEQITETGEISYVPVLYVDGENCAIVEHGINMAVVDNELNEIVVVAGFDANEGYRVVKK
jgi:hypothetical protein